MPQSSATVWPFTWSRWHDPVTSRAAPANVISNRLAFGQGVALEQDGKPLLVLRHEGGLPPSPAALIEQVRQRVFILARVAG